MQSCWVKFIIFDKEQRAEVIISLADFTKRRQCCQQYPECDKTGPPLQWHHVHLRTFSKEFRGWGNRENRWNYSGSLNLLTSSGRKMSGQRELRQVSLPWGWFHCKGKKGSSPGRGLMLVQWLGFRLAVLRRSGCA